MRGAHSARRFAAAVAIAFVQGAAVATPGASPTLTPRWAEVEILAAANGVRLIIDRRAVDYGGTSVTVFSPKQGDRFRRFCRLRLPATELLSNDLRILEVEAIVPGTWVRLRDRFADDLAIHEAAHCLDPLFFEDGHGYHQREAYADAVMAILMLAEGRADALRAFADLRRVSVPEYLFSSAALLDALLGAADMGELAGSFERVTGVSLAAATMTHAMRYASVLKAAPGWPALFGEGSLPRVALSSGR